MPYHKIKDIQSLARKEIDSRKKCCCSWGPRCLELHHFFFLVKHEQWGRTNFIRLRTRSIKKQCTKEYIQNAKHHLGVVDDNDDNSFIRTEYSIAPHHFHPGLFQVKGHFSSPIPTIIAKQCGDITKDPKHNQYRENLWFRSPMMTLSQVLAMKKSLEAKYAYYRALSSIKEQEQHYDDEEPTKRRKTNKNGVGKPGRRDDNGDDDTMLSNNSCEDANDNITRNLKGDDFDNESNEESVSVTVQEDTNSASANHITFDSSSLIATTSASTTKTPPTLVVVDSPSSSSDLLSIHCPGIIHHRLRPLDQLSDDMAGKCLRHWDYDRHHHCWRSLTCTPHHDELYIKDHISNRAYCCKSCRKVSSMEIRKATHGWLWEESQQKQEQQQQDAAVC